MADQIEELNNRVAALEAKQDHTISPATIIRDISMIRKHLFGKQRDKSNIAVVE
jgi:hypothetical protein